MCGLCGFIHQTASPSHVYETALAGMTTVLAHRGPDGYGKKIFSQAGYHIGLGHQRLAIIDLSDLGSQPMCNEDGSKWIVFNGEIYNYKALAEKLRRAGHVFRSASDTEVILHLYEQDGPACVNQLEGMFAFAVVDITARSVFMVRDRIGIKPLFYTELPTGIAFASELKSLLLFPGISTQLVSSSVDAYFTLGYVPGPQTIFKDLCAVMPGQWLLWKDNTLKVQNYWSALSQQAPFEADFETLADELDALLNQAVRSHLVADVGVGAFLSGGVDSSLVAALAARHTGTKLHTYTIGFSGSSDERPYARIVADHIGSSHHERMVEPDDTALLPRYMWHLEQPLFDNSVLPTHAVSAFAREHGKVVVSGDGGDEPFAGYGWTRAAAGIPGMNLPVNIPGWLWLYRTNRFGFFQRGLYDILMGGVDRYLRRMTTPGEYRHWLYTKKFGESTTTDPCDELRTLMCNAATGDTRQRYVIADLMRYLPEDVLCKVDRMSMANSLEVRVPLLDHRLVEWSLRLPWNMRCKGSQGKVLLRHVGKRYLPPEILKPRKQGFTVPIQQWMRGPLGDTALAVFESERFAARGIIDSRRAGNLVRLHRSGRYNLGHRIWSLLVFETWCRVWLDNEPYQQSMNELFAWELKEAQS
jgi:asparagine synthase (glutamine-hydrolysing)